MQSFDYIVPITYTPEKNNSKIRKREFLFKTCAFEELNPEACSKWMSEKCPADTAYCQPYIKGDIIYSQVKYNPNTITGAAVINIIDLETGLSHSPTFTKQTGSSNEKNYFLNFNLDTSQSLFDTVSCFVIKITSEVSGYPVEQYSEPYCVVKCEQKTILVEGTYTAYDCNGHFYGTFTGGQQSIYRSQFRVYGEVVKTGFDFEAQENTTPKSTFTTKSRTVSVYKMYVSKIPPYVAEQLAQCFGAQYVYVDGVQYDKPSKMSKDFDEGQSWIPLVELRRKCEQLDFTCG